MSNNLSYEAWRDQFPRENEINLKIAHIARVVNNSIRLTNDLGLNAADKHLAKFIAQHHDDGRFIQWTTFHTFREDEHPHAPLGLKVLFDEKYIDIWGPEFDATERKIVRLAIGRHSGFHPKTDDLTERENLHLTLIRDADVLDNLVNSFLYWDLSTLFSLYDYSAADLPSSRITPAIYDKFMNDEDISYADVKTPLDIWLLWTSQANQLVFPESRAVLSEIDWPEKMFGRVIFDNSVSKAELEKLAAHSRSRIEA